MIGNRDEESADLKEESPQQAPRGVDAAINLLIVLALGVVLASIYAPLLYWLSRTTLRIEQLHNGGLIVLLALVFSLRRACRTWWVAPQATPLGLALIGAGIASLSLVYGLPGLAIPLALLSFCLSFAGVSAFLFSAAGVRAMLPAMAGILVLGILTTVVPTLDWPLRSIAAKGSAALLGKLGMNVNVALHVGRPPQLLLAVQGRMFVVAAECNGFGLLTSSILAAAILAFHYRLRWLDKLLLVGITVPLAILSNTLRIVGICLAATHLPLPYMLVHEGIGVVSYAVTLWGLWWLAHRRATREPERQV
jgi:exosortase/archaeosortase family protein